MYNEGFVLRASGGGEKERGTLPRSGEPMVGRISLKV